MENKLIVFAGPSGSGKTTLAHHVLDHVPSFRFSISATTRERRPGEIEGKHYHFLSLETFREKIKQGEFVEWEEVYTGTFYGTLKSEIARLEALGKHVVFDIDVQGALNIKKLFGNRALTILVAPPSIERLIERLKTRGTEAIEKFNERVAKAEQELSYAPQFDRVLVNDKLEEAFEEAKRIIKDFMQDP